MKFLQTLILITLMMGSYACTNDSDTAATTSGWKISKYVHHNNDKTSDYSGYVFDFQSNGVLLATKGSSLYTGTWKEVTDSNRTKLIIAFGSPTDLLELSEDWLIGTKTESSIKLSNTSGNSANIGVDILEFSK
jgi:hypothetical protein